MSSSWEENCWPLVLIPSLRPHGKSSKLVAAVMVNLNQLSRLGMLYKTEVYLTREQRQKSNDGQGNFLFLQIITKPSVWHPQLDCSCNTAPECILFSCPVIPIRAAIIKTNSSKSSRSVTASTPNSSLPNPCSSPTLAPRELNLALSLRLCR